MTKSWADGPLSLIETPKSKLKGAPENAATKFATEMANVHNVLIRGLNCITLQAANVKEQRDVDDFIVFASTWHDLVEEHHSVEEVTLFPMIEEDSGIKGIMERNFNQHKAFHHGLAHFNDYVKAVMKGQVEYESAVLLKLVANFATMLTEHLQDEIVTLVMLSNHDINFHLIAEAIAKYAQQGLAMDTIIPFILTNVDLDFEDGIHRGVFPPFPPEMIKIFREVEVPKHEGVWRFSSCDSLGRRKAPAFA